MPRSTPYDRQISFALYSAENPREPHSGVSLDAEFNAVKLAMDETQQNLARIQDDDGVLKRGSVGRAQLDSSITIGFDAPASWHASTAYDAEVSTVFYASKFYICTVTHVSGLTFDAGNWEMIADFTVAAIIDDGSITSVKLAPGAVGSDKIADGSISNSKLASGAVSETKLANSAVTTTKYADASITPAKIADPVLMLSALLPVGLGPLPWSRKNLPSGWDWADGGVLLPDTAFPALRAAYIEDNFPFGQDGSGNPRKPDQKGRSVSGRDDMGGSAANRLTAAGSGIDGLTLGATGGAQSIVLSQNHLPNVNFTVVENNHVHTVREAQSTGQSRVAGSGNPSDPLVINGITQVDVSSQPAKTNLVVNSGGSGAALNKMGPTLVCNAIIKAH